jgi:hypothetical protein
MSKNVFEVRDDLLKWVNQAEQSKSPYDFIQLRRIINGDLLEAIEAYGEEQAGRVRAEVIEWVA